MRGTFLAVICIGLLAALDATRLDQWRLGRQRQSTYRHTRSACGFGETCQYFSNCLILRGRISGTCSKGFRYGVCCRTRTTFYLTLAQLRLLLGYTPMQQTNVIPQSTPKPRIRDCGRRKIPPKRESRIVNGNDATFGEFPWQVIVTGSEETCGGALLNSHWVITAAHCINKDDVADLIVIAGELNLDSKKEPLREQNRTISSIIIHTNFNSTSYEYDLALLMLTHSIVLQPHIQPICLPDKSANYIGRYGIATGWGEIYPAGREANILQKVSLPIVSSRNCEKMFSRSGLREHISSFFICAGYKEGQKDACQGDSGGPLQVRELDGSFTLVGVMSWGIGCAEPNQPGVYTKVSDFVSWIRRSIASVDVRKTRGI